MRKSKKKILDLESNIARLTTSLEILYETINRQSRAIRFLSTHSNRDIVIRPNKNIIEIEYCGPNGFNIAVFIDSYLLDHIKEPVITHDNTDTMTIFSVNNQIYCLDKLNNTATVMSE